MSSPLLPLPRADAPQPALVAALADRYLPLRHLADGAEATVWLARDLHDGAEVALKCCARRPGRRALHELASLLDLRHPRIVPFRDFRYLPSGEMIIVSDYVSGGSLRKRADLGPMPAAQASAVAADILQALGYLHSRGVVHRDIKPDNILVAPGPEGDVYLLADFGIAGRVDDAALGDGVVGSPGYLAPENYQRRAGPQGDLYSLGITLHELLAGRRPFEGEGAALARAHLASPPPPLTGDAAALQPFVHALLEKDPRHRTTDTGAALALLDALLPGPARHAPRPIAAPPILPSLRFGPASRLVLASSFHLPGEAPGFDLSTLDGRPCLVLDHGSHLALHDAANGASAGVLLPKSGATTRLDHLGFIVRSTARAAIAWDTRLRTETILAELSRPCAHLAWEQSAGLLATTDGSRLHIHHPHGDLAVIRLPEGFHAPRLVWLDQGRTLAAAGGLLRPELRLYSPAGELLQALPLPGAILDAPRHGGTPVWLVIDHAAQARIAALQLSPDGGWLDLLLPEMIAAHVTAADGLLVLLANRELLHVSAERGHLPLGPLHPETRQLALSADSRHLLAARRSGGGTEFTLYAHQHD